MKETLAKFHSFLIESEGLNIEIAREAIENEGYEYVEKGNVLKVLDDNRDDALNKLTSVLGRLGFTHNPIIGGSLGRLEIKDKVRGNVYILFKPKSRKRAATAGIDFEDRLATEISNMGMEATTAGYGHGSDLTITGANQTITAEVKTSLSADFGQFRVQYSTKEGTWQPRRTKQYIKNKHIFTPLFDELLKEYLNAHCILPLGDKRLNQDDYGKVFGLKASLTTGDLKRELQAEWFKGKTDYKKDFEFSRIAGYYADKGDQYIQIGSRGLYALTPEAATNLQVPLFSNSGLKAYIRFRLKPSVSENSSTSFTAAIKIKGRLGASELSLTNPADVEKLKALLA
tara:strand:+ start:6428 stop:7456 length:1029 start_codon:yes stop_codon:yes gene_type:complete